MHDTWKATKKHKNMKLQHHDFSTHRVNAIVHMCCCLVLYNNNNNNKRKTHSQHNEKESGKYRALSLRLI
jgi:prephenate dehydrogenase